VVAEAHWILDRRVVLDVPLRALSSHRQTGVIMRAHQIFPFRSACCRRFDAICLAAIATARWRKYSSGVLPRQWMTAAPNHGESGMASP